MQALNHHYQIACHHICLTGVAADLVGVGLSGFSPFEHSASPKESVMTTIETGCTIDADNIITQPLTEFDFEEGQALCRFGRNSSQWVLTISASHSQPFAIACDCNDTTYFRCNANADTNPSFLRFGLWFAVNIAAVSDLTAAVHSSVIVWNGEAVMFLGESGTGKSTHTRLWRENILGATLLNDDSPFIRAEDGKVMVYGSPWSGKTPCYKDECYPLRAIVRLSQAPHNKIFRQKGAQAIGALLPSLPPAFAYDAKLEDWTLSLLSEVVSQVPIYHLECLPDADAARLSHKTVFEL